MAVLPLYPLYPNPSFLEYNTSLAIPGIKLWNLPSIGNCIKDLEYPNTKISLLLPDIEYIKKFEVEEDLIVKIKKKYSIKNFDLVIIDGSEFTGEKELDLVWGSSIICLDDVNGYKNFNSYHRLKNSDEYAMLDENLQDRHGYATFYKR